MGALVELLGGFEERPRVPLHGGEPLAEEVYAFLVNLDNNGWPCFENQYHAFWHDSLKQWFGDSLWTHRNDEVLSVEVHLEGEDAVPRRVGDDVPRPPRVVLSRGEGHVVRVWIEQVEEPAGSLNAAR
jgi:hypothetical protein